LKKNLSVNAIGFLLVSLMFFTSVTIMSPNIAYAQESMTFTSGEEINFTSDTEMTFKGYESMQFWSGVKMKFGTNITIQFIETEPDGWLVGCDILTIIWSWPPGYLIPECSWWEVIDPATGELLGEFHVDWHDPPMFHIDGVYPGPISVPIGGVITAREKIDIVEPCETYVVHWPEHWWPTPCSWWEIIHPETGELTGYEFHVDWTNESCEFHIDEMIPGPYILDFPWYEVWARRKIPDIKTCDDFVVEEPEHWWPDPCTWWEIIDFYTGEPTGYNFHVDWTNESCEFHIDMVEPGAYLFKFPVPYVIAEKKITEIKPCDWFIVVDPIEYLPNPCSWWEVLDDTGAPTGLEFHVDVTDGFIMFHVDETSPDIIITIPPSYTVTVRKKIDLIQPCTWFRVDDPSLTPESCSWWEILDDTGAPTGIEFHVDQTIPADGLFHIDEVLPSWPIEVPPTYMLTAEKKIDDIEVCDWFKVLDPPDFVPEPCSWWVIIWPPVWAGIHFHVDANDDVDMFHIDDVNGGGPPPPPPPPPPWNVTAVPYEPPSLPWYMKAPYPDYAPSGMPDFDQRQGGTYPWQDPTGGRWSHCGPVAVANSLWWLDSEFEPNTIGPPAMIDNYPLVQTYGQWDDHNPLNVPPLVEHLAYLMDTDGLRTGTAHLGTNVFDMEAGITHYLSWSGVNPLGDVDGDGEVTPLDESIVMDAMGSSPGMPGWDLRADIWPETLFGPYVADNIIDMNDWDLVMMHMGMPGQFYEHTVMAPMWDLILEEVEKCQDVVLLIAPWMYDEPEWYRYDEVAHFVTVAGLNGSHLGTELDPWEIVFSDPMLDNAEAGGYGDVPVPHVHPGSEPPYITHNNASLVSHDAYHIILDPEPCPGGPLTLIDYPRDPQPYPIWKWQIEAAVITSPLAVRDVAVTNLKACYGATIIASDQDVCVNVTVTNEGTVAEAFTLTAYWNTTNVIDTTGVTLASGETKNVTLSWDTTGHQEYANYALSAYATTVPGEIDTSDNTYIDGTILMVHTGDVTNDHKVDISDIFAIALAYGSHYGEPKYNPNLDINCDGKIDITDIFAAALNYGWRE
jgi:hypothetical protein